MSCPPTQVAGPSVDLHCIMSLSLDHMPTSCWSCHRPPPYCSQSRVKCFPGAVPLLTYLFFFWTCNLQGRVRACHQTLVHTLKTLMKKPFSGPVEPRSTCEWCGLKSENSRDNRAHRKSCPKKPSAKSFSCPHCDEKTFETQSGLQQHQRITQCAAAILGDLNHDVNVHDRACHNGYNPPENKDGPMLSSPDVTTTARSSHHSARDFCMKPGHRETAAPPQGVSFSRKPKLNLPPTNDKDAWKKIDYALENTIPINYTISDSMTPE